MIDRLETFFLNPVETNLALTEAFCDLIVCGYVSVEGWFLRSPQKYVYDEETMESEVQEPPSDPESPEYAEYMKMKNLQHCRRRPRWTQSSLPRLRSTLQTLADQVAAYQDTIPRFDDLLQQRREAFQTTDSAIPTPSRTGPGMPPLSRTQQPTLPCLIEQATTGQGTRPRPDLRGLRALPSAFSPSSVLQADQGVLGVERNKTEARQTDLPLCRYLPESFQPT